ncbi:MAG: phosphopentomutase [Clostridiales Family XIII bacterium]|jgi:phosphopentomutase|nr:phosphopentomutase [Clostridiales Family XIII bacterium]
MKRVILIVLDSLGVGAMPDAAAYGDTGADTLGHIWQSCPDMKFPHLRAQGFANVDAITAAANLGTTAATGAFGRCSEASKGKDTITGHWEIAGLQTDVPFLTFEHFPEDFIRRFEKEIGREVLGNYPASGTVIIEDLGPEHEATGKPIVYTSHDSVFQIAACTDVIPLAQLYEFCETARALLTGPIQVGRVIARPYIIEGGRRVRTSDRRDYSVPPPEKTLLDILTEADRGVTSIGKIHDIFSGCGTGTSIHTEDNAHGIRVTIEEMKKDGASLIFTNLVDFDSKYGHRRDPAGYAKAIEEFDAALPEIQAALRPDDILLLTADHGNDPIHSGFDHTREYIPLALYGKNVRPAKDLGTRTSFADIGASVADYLGVPATAHGVSFLGEIL